MTSSLLLAHAARAAVLLAAALVATRVLARAPAAARRLILAVALAAVVVMPIVSAFAPRWGVAPTFEAPAAAIADVPVLAPIAEPLGNGLTVVAPTPAVPAEIPWAAIALGVWALGAMIVLGRTVASTVQARRLARSGEPLDPDSARVADALVDGRARVLASEAVDAPLVTGVVRPTILVPPAARAWSRERWRVVLLHELEHVRRRDCLAQLVARVACALHWFDPLAWIAARRLRVERELAADDAVLVAGARASSYAEHLVALAVASNGEPAGALAMAASPLEARVRALLVGHDRARTLGRAGARAIVAATACAAFAVACAGSRAVSASPATGADRAPTTAADPRLQRIVDEELVAMGRAWDATATVAVAIDPRTGEVVARSGRVDEARTPGSTLKPFTIAAVIDEGSVRPTDRFDCENGAHTYPDGGTLHDASKNGSLDVGEVLAVSSNVCTAKIAQMIDADRLRADLQRFHLGDAPGALPAIDLGTLHGAYIAVGEGVAVTPTQLASAFAALANGGVYRRGRGSPDERAVREETAQALMTMLEGVVTAEHATGTAARVDGVRVAGKTGTADLGHGRVYASFVGVFPADAPRLVLLVGAETAKDGASGGAVAAPAFSRIATRWLAP